MKRLIPFCLLGLSVVAARAETWEGRATIAFTGVSTLHEFRGHGTTEVFEADIAPDRGSIACGAEVRVLDLTTDEKARDKKMYEMFHAAEFSTISASVTGVRSDATNVPLRVNIMGKEQTLVAVVSDHAGSPGGISFALTFDLSLAKTGLEAPTAMAGLIKVRDAVHVVVHVEMVNPN